jgi:hypothetical protein
MSDVGRSIGHGGQTIIHISPVATDAAERRLDPALHFAGSAIFTCTRRRRRSELCSRSQHVAKSTVLATLPLESRVTAGNSVA